MLMSSYNFRDGKVLSVFQHMPLARRLAYELSFAGFDVIFLTMKSMPEMAQWVQAIWPDLLLFQLEAPSETLPFLSQVRQSLGTYPPPIMVLGPGSQSDIEAGYKAGVDDWLTPPFFGKTLARVRQLLGKKAGGG
jgi:DNA-binding response OmpR family regulator